MSILGADCHAHLFGHDYPTLPDCDYRPDPSQVGTVDRFLALLDAHGLSHGLVVAPEPYGTVNDCITDGIRAANGRLKGIALVRPDVDDRELRCLADAGVVGVRYNLTSFGMRQFRHPATTRLFARLKEMGWFLQVHCQNDELAAAAPMLRRSGVRVMIDHFARPDPRKGLEQAGFRALLALGRTGNAVVKLSGPFRCSHQAPPYADVEPYVAAAVDAFTLENCVWGSDWPFVRVDERIDFGPELACLARWFPDGGDRAKVLADNPARLFGFR
jgi:predicted TIM-barrel fold metal-dependent hydrolase